MPAISILTPSYNKSIYVLDSIKSVIGQTFKDIEYFIVENSTDEKTRGLVDNYVKSLNDPRVHLFFEDYPAATRIQYYVPSLIINKYFDLMHGDYILYLSDDDILDLECVEKVMDMLKTGVSACSFKLRKQIWRNGKFVADNGDITPSHKTALGEGIDCVIDGGQIVISKACLPKLGQPYYRVAKDGDSHHCDGLFLNRLTKIVHIFPIFTEKPLVYHRQTEISLWTQG